VTLGSDLSAGLGNYVLDIGSGASVVLASNQNAGGVQIVGSGTLDVGVYSLALNYGVGNPSPESMVQSYLAAGAIFSSTVKSNPRDAVGYADGSIDSGTAAQPGQVLIEYTLDGDVNLDRTVNFADLLAVAQNFNKTGEDWAGGNFNYGPTGLVNFGDLLIVAQSFNSVLTPAAGAAVQSGGTIFPLAESATVEVPTNPPAPAPGNSYIAAPGPSLAADDSDADGAILQSGKGGASVLSRHRGRFSLDFSS